MRGLAIFAVLALSTGTFAQQIQDIYYTSWNQSSLFAYQKAPSTPASFGQPGTSGQATITIDDTQIYQTVDGFGATLTDTSAATLLELKKANFGKYWELLRKMFDVIDDRNAGFSYLRVSLGASDLSPFPYNFDEVPNDPFLIHFSMNKEAPVFEVIRNIRTINPTIKVHIVPWSPPAWMKVDQPPSLYGGTFNHKYVKTYASFLLRATIGIELAIGARPYAIAIQNEPLNSNPTYPTCLMTPDDEGQIGVQLRSLLNGAGLGNTKIIGFEHNWVNATNYPVELMNKYGSAFAGVAFHCYGGSYRNQAEFAALHPDKEIYFTECTGTIGSDPWGDLKWWMDNLFIGSVSYGARTALMWNLAAHSDGGPLLPNTTSCGGGVTPGCRPIVNINGGSYSFNQEFNAIAQAQRATLPTSLLGQSGKRISSTIGGTWNWALRANAFVTPAGKGKDRYSLLVLNWYDNASPGPINPVDVTTTINFRGLQANYTFPVGVTTLSWLAPSNGKVTRDLAEDQVEVEVEHRAVNVTHATSPANGLRKHRAHARLSHNH